MPDASPETPSAEKASRRGLLKSLYHWVLHWAETPYGTPVLFLLSFAESSFFPIPPDVLQIALSVSKPRRSFFYATVSGLGSVAGAILGWTIGAALWFAVGDFFHSYVPGCSVENFAKVEAYYNSNALFWIFAAAFTPIPFKVFTIAAGIFSVPLWILLLASSVGRFGRFFIVAVCIFYFGPSVKALLEKYFEIVTFVLFALLVAGFVAVTYLL